MVFSSLLFLYVFLPIFLICYTLVPSRIKNYVILLFSIVFYAWGAPKFLFVLLASLSVNFYIVKQLHTEETHRKLLLSLSLLINLGLLAYFKYANFFIDNLNFILEQLKVSALNWTRVALPIGISFFTFQSLTYTVDVYRKIHQPLNKLSDYLLYIMMFPQLIAGPIVRFNTIADDIIDRKANETAENKLTGFYRFVIGLSKKVLIANTVGVQADRIFASPIAEMDSGVVWIGIIAYSFQIYFDFSGYSDMAIGLGRMIGFNFPENFNSPYISRSITEFWRRWHITLSTWMRDYLYIPLGGNRVKNNTRLYANLIIVFLLSGLWHGSSWNFVIWGAWHGLFLILDRLFLQNYLKRAPGFFQIILTYIVVLIGWVFFRIEDFSNAIAFISKMFTFEFSNTNIPDGAEFWFILFVAALFSFITAFKFGEKLADKIFKQNYSLQRHIVVFTISLVLLLLCTAYLSASGFNPFIYFRF